MTVKPPNLPGRPPTVTVPSGAEFARLSDLIARQRRELDRMQSGAAGRSVVDLARGMLMERLRCSPAEAQAQLAHLSAESGTSLAELAAQITGHVTAQPETADPGEQDGPGAAEAAMPSTHRVALAGAAAEAAHDGAGIAAAAAPGSCTSRASPCHSPRPRRQRARRARCASGCWARCTGARYRRAATACAGST